MVCQTFDLNYPTYSLILLCSYIFIVALMYLLFISPSPGEWEARTHVPLLFLTCFPEDMCSLWIPCGFQTQLVLPIHSYYYALKNNIGSNKNIWKGCCIDKAKEDDNEK